MPGKCLKSQQPEPTLSLWATVLSGQSLGLIAACTLLYLLPKNNSKNLAAQPDESRHRSTSVQDQWHWQRHGLSPHLKVCSWTSRWVQNTTWPIDLALSGLRCLIQTGLQTLKGELYLSWQFPGSTGEQVFTDKKTAEESHEGRVKTARALWAFKRRISTVLCEAECEHPPVHLLLCIWMCVRACVLAYSSKVISPQPDSSGMGIRGRFFKKSAFLYSFKSMALWLFCCSMHQTGDGFFLWFYLHGRQPFHTPA